MGVAIDAFRDVKAGNLQQDSLLIVEDRTLIYVFSSHGVLCNTMAHHPTLTMLKEQPLVIDVGK